MPIYEQTLQQVSWQAPPAEMLQLLGAISRNQEETDQFLGLISGGTSIRDFFAPENVQRIMSSAGAVS